MRYEARQEQEPEPVSHGRPDISAAVVDLPSHLTNEGVLALSHGRFVLGLAPRLGGSLVYFAERRGDRLRHWFRPATADAMRSGTGHHAACFPLVPVSGRIAAARLAFAGQVIEVPRNVGFEPNHLHGEGWQRSWGVQSSTPRSADLALDGGDGPWPFPYVARFAYELVDDGLDVTMELVNTGPGEMPAAIGLHPWFPRPPGRLTANACTVWEINENKLFASKASPKPAWRFADGRDLASSDLEHGFSDWDGTAVIEWPGRPGRLVMQSSESLRHLVVYTRDPSGDFCVEPVSCSVDAFNLAARGVEGTGTIMLAPGQALVGAASFRVEG